MISRGEFVSSVQLGRITSLQARTEVMSTRRKRRLPLNVWRKLAVLETFFTPAAKRRTSRDRTAAMALLVEYADGGTPEAVPTESGRCYICMFPAS